jgi:hypothetical protein
MIGELIILKSRKMVYSVKLYTDSRFLIEPVLQDTGKNQCLKHKAETNRYLPGTCSAHTSIPCPIITSQ